MGFKCGIIGLPNVGKSTLFNCLSNSKAQSANFPFCTIEPNFGVINVRIVRQSIRKIVQGLVLTHIMEPGVTQSANKALQPMLKGTSTSRVVEFTIFTLTIMVFVLVMVECGATQVVLVNTVNSSAKTAFTDLVIYQMAPVTVFPVTMGFYAILRARAGVLATMESAKKMVRVLVMLGLLAMTVL